MSALRTQGLAVRYGGVQALHEVDFTIRAGQLVGLIGPNGAGKTTFIDAITGFARSTGRVWIDDREVTGLEPHERARAGLARTFQGAELFDELTVRENVAASIRLPAAALARELLTGRTRPDLAADRILAGLGLEALADALPEVLSQGQRKLVGVARALVAAPRVVCLDEPAAGLDTTESRELGRRLRALVEAGQSMLLVDHDMGLVLSVCDEIIVLDFGRVICRGTPEAVKADPQVREAYLGKSASGTSAPPPARIRSVERESQPTIDGPILKVEGLCAGYGSTAVIRDVSFEVRPGEVLALLGPNGAGKTTTLRAISRLINPLAGCIRYCGDDLAGVAPHRLPKRGLMHVPEDRGVFMGLTVAEHFRAAPDGPFDLAQVLEYFPALAPLRHRRAGLLSGGEQQMLALALALVRAPRLLLIDELSLGLAPVIVERLLPVVRDYATRAKAGVVLVEQHVPLALEVADRACVLTHGAVALCGDAMQLRGNQELLMASYLGEAALQASTAR